MDPKIEKVIKELEQAQAETQTEMHAEKVAGNVVKEAHANGQYCGLTAALSLLRSAVT